MKRTGALVFALAFFFAGCGKFSSSGSEEPTATTAPGEIGSGLGVATTQPNAAVAAPTPAPTAAPAADPCKTAPRSSSVVRDNRLKLVVTVSGTCFKHADDIGLSLVVTNTSSQTINYDPNQILVFTIKAPVGEQRRRWESDDCTVRTAEKKQALALAPGASVTLGATYPAAKDFGDREKCRRLENGAYEVQAVFLVCDESYQDGYCDISKDTQVEAAPVAITLSA